MLSRTKPLRSCASLWTLSSRPRCSIGQASLHAAATAQVDTALQKLGLDPWVGFGVGIEKVRVSQAVTDCLYPALHITCCTANEHKRQSGGLVQCSLISSGSCCSAFISWSSCWRNATASSMAHCLGLPVHCCIRTHVPQPAANEQADTAACRRSPFLHRGTPSLQPCNWRSSVSCTTHGR